jgi:hypothetical protein
VAERESIDEPVQEIVCSGGITLRPAGGGTKTEE